MARMPSAIELARSTPQAGRAIPHYSVSPIGAALQGLGGEIVRIGKAGLAQANEKALQDEKFGAQTRFLQFEDNWRKAATDRAENAQPGAAGFTDALKKDYTTGAQEFFRSISEDLKPEYDLKLADLEGRLASSADQFASAERDRFSLEQVQNGQNTLLDRQNGDPSSWASIRKEGEDLATSGLNPIVADEQVRKWRQRQAVALFQTRNTSDPIAARAGLGIAGGAVEPLPGGRQEAGAYGRASQVQARLMSKGWSQHAAAAIAGGLIQESGANANSIGGQGSEGMAQWRGDRLTNLKTFATAQGQDWHDFDTQVDFIDWELRHTEKGSGDALMSAQNVDQAAEAAIGYERPQGWSAGDPRGGHGWDNRYGAAQRLAGSAPSVPAPEYADIPYEDRVKLYEASQKDERRTVGNQLEDYTAYLRSGMGAQSGDADASRFQLPELARVYGPQDGALLRDQIDKAAAYGKDVAAVAFAPPDELNRIVADREAFLSEPEAFRQHLQDVNGLLGVIKERNAALLKDPALYVQKDPEVAVAYGAMTQAPDNPVMVSNYAEATLAKQAELGLPPEQQKILPVDAQQSIVSQFKNQPEGGQNAPQLMQGLQSQWGKYWPQVFGEMAKDLPGSALVIGSMVHPEQQRGAEQLAQASALGSDVLEKALPNSTVRDVKNAVEGDNGTTSVLEGFSGTFAHTGNMGARTLGAVRESIYQLALSYAAQGEQGAAAAAHAYDDVIGKAYTMTDTYRVPIQYDADAVQAGAEHVLQNVNADNWAMPTSLMGLPEDQTKAAYLDSVKAHGFWVTAPDESGLTLWDGLQPVLTTAGNQVHVGWQELIDVGVNVPKSSVSPSLFGNPQPPYMPSAP